MKHIFRRNTSPVGMQDTAIGFGIPNKVERLKKGPGYKFRERDRVKVIAPKKFAQRTGYIVESHHVQNEHGLMEIELDYELPETVADASNNYVKLMNDRSDEPVTKNGEEAPPPPPSTEPPPFRTRLTIKNPDKQLIPYKYMNCQYQHYVTSIRAESLLQISVIATTLLGFDILMLIIVCCMDWNHKELFVAFMLSCCGSIGFGFYCVLITAFIGFNLKKVSVKNRLPQLGGVHDECTSYHWLKSTHWKPWWLALSWCRSELSVIEWCIKQTGKVMLVFVLLFMLSIVLYIADHSEWYIMLVCMLLITIPSLFALHLIKNREMMQFV